MSNLISGKEALIALANGEEVECSITGKNDWTTDIYGVQPYYFLGGGIGQFEFRLKPHTITINGIEVPAPFEPKEGDTIFVLSNFLQQGFIECKYPTFENHVFQFGVWRTEEEIKQVVAALRTVFGGINENTI